MLFCQLSCWDGVGVSITAAILERYQRARLNLAKLLGIQRRKSGGYAE